MNKSFWLILGVVVIGLVGLFIATGGKDDSGTGGQTLQNPSQVQESDHVRGSRTAKAVLIEYGDFECPGCGAFFPVVQQIKEDYGDKLALVFRNFPLLTIHPNAMQAHRAAGAAAKQDKFWEMHDLLYERQQEWYSQAANQSQAVTMFESYAKELGLDQAKYKTDVASEDVFNLIDTHMKSGRDLGITSTPSLLLNGKKIEASLGYEGIKAEIDKILGDDAPAATDGAEAADEANPTTPN